MMRKSQRDRDELGAATFWMKSVPSPPPPLPPSRPRHRHQHGINSTFPPLPPPLRRFRLRHQMMFSRLQNKSVIVAMLSITLLGSAAVLKSSFLLHQHTFVASKESAIESPGASSDSILEFPVVTQIASDFMLTPEIEEANYRINDPRVLRKWQSRRWRRAPSTALLDNKLLCHSFLRALGLPTMNIIYGGFTSKQIGTWPKFDVNDLAHAIGDKRSFVVKSLTGSMSRGVRKFTPDNRTSQAELIQAVTKHAMAVSFAKKNYIWNVYGRMYDNFGVIVEELFATPNAEKFEVKLDVAIRGNGKRFIAGAKIVQLPPSLCRFRINLCNMHKPTCHIYGEKPGKKCRPDEKFNCTKAQALITAFLPQLEVTALKVAQEFALDFVRVDFFVAVDGNFVINEVTYPSYLGCEQCVLRGLGAVYANFSSAIQEVNSTEALSRMLKCIGITPEEVLDESDANLPHAFHLPDSVYDLYDGMGISKETATRQEMLGKARNVNGTSFLDWHEHKHQL